jgi:hypothetical protein
MASKAQRVRAVAHPPPARVGPHRIAGDSLEIGGNGCISTLFAFCGLGHLLAAIVSPPAAWPLG